MPETLNLASIIEKQLPVQFIKFLESAGLISANLGWRLYLVGGIVRDLLLGRGSLDIDVVVEGNAISLGQRLTEITGSIITTHSRFGTAKIKWDKWTIDLATARTEIYARPGALPTTKPGSLSNDLFRRDFTINAMAIGLVSGQWGQLIDPFGGQHDLKRKIIRSLHKNSFTDDATRIWRAIRYEQRLGFNIEPVTLGLLRRDIPRLGTISGDRLRHELDLALREAIPEKVLCRASELGVLTSIHPRLKVDGWLTKKFSEARYFYHPKPPSIPLYLSLFTYSLSPDDRDKFISILRIPKQTVRIMEDTAELKSLIIPLSQSKLRRSRIYRLLYRYSSAAIEAIYIAADSQPVRKHIRLYLNELRYVKSATRGASLIKLGVPAGPRVKEITQILLDAHLDGQVQSKKDEVRLVKSWLQS